MTSDPPPPPGGVGKNLIFSFAKTHKGRVQNTKKKKSMNFFIPGLGGGVGGHFSYFSTGFLRNA